MRITYAGKNYPLCNATTLAEAESMAECPNSSVEPLLAVAKALIREPVFLLKDYAESFSEVIQNIRNETLGNETFTWMSEYVDSTLYTIEVNYRNSKYSFATPRRQAEYCFYVNRFHVSFSTDIDAAFWLKPLPWWLWVIFFVLSAIPVLFNNPDNKQYKKLLILLSSIHFAIAFVENAGLKADALQKLYLRFPYRTFEHLISGLQAKKIRLLITQQSWDQLENFLNGTSLFQTLENLKSVNFSQITTIKNYRVGCQLLVENAETENAMVVLIDARHMVVKCGFKLVNQLFEYRLRKSPIPPIFNAYAFNKNSRRYREIYSRMAEYFNVQEHKHSSSVSDLLKRPLTNPGDSGRNGLPIEALTELCMAFGIGITLSVFVFVFEKIINHKQWLRNFLIDCKN